MKLFIRGTKKPKIVLNNKSYILIFIALKLKVIVLISRSIIINIFHFENRSVKKFFSSKQIYYVTEKPNYKVGVVFVWVFKEVKDFL